ncbi:MAG: type II secretion system minor pseudopilin GspK [Steroidobacteraceae bacterium]
MKARRAQRGIALLTAIILVAIATIIAAAVSWQSALHARRGIAVFTMAQSLAFSQLAEAYAGFILRQNRSKFPKDTNPTQDWARPYGPLEIDAGTILEGSIEDQAGKFNLNSLVDQPNPGGSLVANKTAVSEFEGLLQSLDIDVKYATRLVDWLDSDDQPDPQGGAEDSYYLAQDPPYRTLNMSLTSSSELLAMGMDRASYDKLRNLVTALPPTAKLNLCTAPLEVLNAVAGQSFANDPQFLSAQRAQFNCFPDVANFLTGVLPQRKAQVQTQVGVTSNYFRLRTWITIGTTRFTLYSLIEQDGSGQIRPILRTFGTE